MQKHEPKPIADLGGRTWEELEIVEHEDGHLLFRDQIRRRAKSGQIISEDVRVRITNARDSIQARAEARLWFGRVEGLDKDRDSDLFDQMEQLCLLARAIRSPEAPYAQLHGYEEFQDYDEASLWDVLGRIEVYKQLTDPRESQIDEARFWELVVAVAKAQHLGPLVGIAGHEQPSFVVRMALEACRSPTAPCSAPSSATSTPAP